jgi:hypothetical protein
MIAFKFKQTFDQKEGHQTKSNLTKMYSNDIILESAKLM